MGLRNDDKTGNDIELGQHQHTEKHEPSFFEHNDSQICLAPTEKQDDAKENEPKGLRAQDIFNEIRADQLRSSETNIEGKVSVKTKPLSIHQEDSIAPDAFAAIPI